MSRRQRRRKKKTSRSPNPGQLEHLEPRFLLTTLFGGEVFEFRAPNPLNPSEDGPIIRISIEGGATVELVASDIDDQNEVILGDLPGLITASDLGRIGAEILGGIGGANGVELIGPTPIDDPASFLTSFFASSFGAGNENIDLQALATSESNLTFGFNLTTVGEDENAETIIQVVSVSNTTGDAL